MKSFLPCILFIFLFGLAKAQQHSAILNIQNIVYGADQFSSKDFGGEGTRNWRPFAEYTLGYNYVDKKNLVLQIGMGYADFNYSSEYQSTDNGQSSNYLSGLSYSYLTAEAGIGKSIALTDAFECVPMVLIAYNQQNKNKQAGLTRERAMILATKYFIPSQKFMFIKPFFKPNSIIKYGKD